MVLCGAFTDTAVSKLCDWRSGQHFINGDIRVQGIIVGADKEFCCLGACWAMMRLVSGRGWRGGLNSAGIAFPFRQSRGRIPAPGKPRAVLEGGVSGRRMVKVLHFGQHVALSCMHRSEVPTAPHLISVHKGRSTSTYPEIVVMYPPRAWWRQGCWTKECNSEVTQTGLVLCRPPLNSLGLCTEQSSLDPNCSFRESVRSTSKANILRLLVSVTRG